MIEPRATISDPLALFQEPVRQWFKESVGEPTPAQRLGWPAIAQGQHTLILAPTGSGKTLAAFLACLDALWRSPLPDKQVQVLYLSPLKALNNDIERNLRVPMAGIRAMAHRLGQSWPELKAAIRSGDTPVAARQKLARHPPHLFITTPESLHLILTSSQREMLRGVRYCIVDEIHVLCPNKRGVFLSLLLERLEQLQGTNRPSSFVRIGLSATQRPLEEVARYLGGAGREVTLIDAGFRKNLDLQVINPVERFGPLPERSVWPSIHRHLLEQIRAHRSTIIFANNRRTVEKLAHDLNELNQADLNQTETGPGNSLEHQAAPLVRPHHGSLSLEVRHATEAALKEGHLRAVVATASLELGIDMGAVDLVCQVESPGNVARAMQRIGRSGHLVGQTSRGRFYPKTPADLLEQAVLARCVMEGEVEPLRVPTNCLDVLAQQIVAMVAIDAWAVPDLFSLIKRAYPYRDLSPEALESVLEMLSGRVPHEAFRDLKARISWDRIHNRLHALPGSQSLALVHGGTIPDTGQYAAYIDGTSIRLGELDEEFVYERRIGDVFRLGTQTWRIVQIESDRVLVAPAEGEMAVLPFWRGEGVGRSLQLGLAIGQFLREASDQLRHGPPQQTLQWLMQDGRLDHAAATNLFDYLKRQIEQAGCLPTDRSLLIEAFRDDLGDWYVVILSPLGSAFHLALRLAIEARWRQRFGYLPQSIHLDEGILIKIMDVDDPPLDLLDDLEPDRIEDLILSELSESALFAIRFRHNAARALLMPRASGRQRAPLWLQRLRARNLLQVCRQYPRFPIVVETYRECQNDHLDVPRLKQWLIDLREGKVELIRRRAEQPCPFAANLLFRFTFLYMYTYDRVDQAKGETVLDRQLLDQLVQPEDYRHLLDERAIAQVEFRLRGMGRPPRQTEELADWLRRLGDLRESEIRTDWRSMLDPLIAQGRVSSLQLTGTLEPAAWILTEELPLYRSAFSLDGETRSEAAARMILQRFMATHALVGMADILSRYPFDAQWLKRELEASSRNGDLVAMQPLELHESVRWSMPKHWEAIQRTSLHLRRGDAPTVEWSVFVQFVLRWQFVHPATRTAGTEGLKQVLERLAGWMTPAELWERAILPSRIKDYQPRWLDELTMAGEWIWWGNQDRPDAPLHVGFRPREDLHHWPGSHDGSLPAKPEWQQVHDVLQSGGAMFLIDLARMTGLPPAQVRQQLRHMVQHGFITNDRFDVIRSGWEEDAASSPATGPSGRFSRLRSGRRVVSQRPQGRWSLLPWGQPETESLALQQAMGLLTRYGLAARELARLDPSLLPWRLLYQVLQRLEFAGEIRRGYFVKGLSGSQFALPECVEELTRLAEQKDDAAMLLHSFDPANLWSIKPSGLTASATEESDEAFTKRRGTWVVLTAGRPTLRVEQYGKRLTPSAEASTEALERAVGLLGSLMKTTYGWDLRGKISVEEWDGQPVIGSPGQPLLEKAGFVRDYQALSLYAVWQ